MNVKFLGTCILTASLLFSAAAQAQSAPDYASIIEQAHQKYKSNHDGKVADYIPAWRAIARIISPLRSRRSKAKFTRPAT